MGPANQIAHYRAMNRTDSALLHCLVVRRYWEMNQLMFELTGGDGGAYGPLFGPVNAVEVAEIDVAEGKKYLVVKLEKPVKVDDMEISYFIVAPRYVGDTIETLKEKGCAVGVSIVYPGKIEQVLASGTTSKNSKYWAVGECKRIHA